MPYCCSVLLLPRRFVRNKTRATIWISNNSLTHINVGLLKHIRLQHHNASFACHNQHKRKQGEEKREKLSLKYYFFTAQISLYSIATGDSPACSQVQMWSELKSAIIRYPACLLKEIRKIAPKEENNAQLTYRAHTHRRRFWRWPIPMARSSQTSGYVGAVGKDQQPALSPSGTVISAQITSTYTA